MTKRCAVQAVSAGTPVGHGGIHKGGKTLAVPPFEQVRHLMYDEVLERLRVFLRQFDVEPDVTGLAIARTPFRLHSSDAPAQDGDTKSRFPLRDHGWYRTAELIPIPPVQQAATLFGC